MPIILILCLYVPLGLALLSYSTLLYCRFRKKRATLVQGPVIGTSTYGTLKPPKDDTCAICLQSFRSQDETALLRCPHTFHWHCLQPWLVVKNQCPLCRVPVISTFDPPTVEL